jgi:hypothetical protein
MAERERKTHAKEEGVWFLLGNMVEEMVVYRPY